MDAPLLSIVPEPAKRIHVQTTDDLVAHLLDAAGYQVKKRFHTESKQQALTQALAEALFATVDKFTDHPRLMTRYLEVFREWSERDAVAGELSQLIDPRDDTELNLESLREEFKALGTTLGFSRGAASVETFVAEFASAFCDAVANQPELQEPIPIGRLRLIAERTERQAREAVALTEPADQPPPPDLTAEDRRYLTGLIRKLNHLPFGALDGRIAASAEKEREIRLHQVYVDLDTMSCVQAAIRKPKRTADAAIPEKAKPRTEERRESALEALAGRRQLVLLGELGSGKTTFLRHVALRCANHWLGEPQADLGPLSALNDRLFPLVIDLREFAAGLNAGAKPRHGHLLTHLQHLLDCDHALPEYWPAIRRRLLAGEAILLLDGYDLVEAHRRPLVAGVIRDFLDHLPDTPLLVTSRTRDYTSETARQLSIPTVSLAPMSSEHVHLLVDTWYEELARLSDQHDAVWARERRQTLLQTIDESDRIQELANVPLALTIMARTNAYQDLPAPQGALYAELLDQLLWHWDHLRPEGQADSTVADLLQEAGKSKEDFLLKLAEFSFEHRSVGGAPGNGTGNPASGAPVTKLNQALCDFHGGKTAERAHWTARVLDALGWQKETTLENDTPAPPLSYPNFEQFLAAVHLAEKLKPTAVAKLTQADDQWHPVALLAAGYLVHQSREDRALNYVDETLPRQPQTADDWQQVKLAGDALAAIPPSSLRESRRGRELTKYVPDQLLRLLETRELAPATRAAGGITLGTLGDPRFDSLFKLPKDLDSYFLPVPGGTFTMGTTPEEVAEIQTQAEWYSRAWDEQGWLDKEQPAHSVTVGDFSMGRYPITNAQYRGFINGGGYTDAGLDTWWPVTGRKAWREGRIKRWSAENGLPSRWSDRQLNTPNAPVVGVSWFEAVAFCHWLTDRLREVGYLDDTQIVRLPTEAEWEYAARGPERRTYPWGDNWDPQLLNWKETGIGAPCSVGVFPAGATPDTELLDMGGNVWEWCQSQWQEYPNHTAREAPASRREDPLHAVRCLRGGAWGGSEPGEYRCAARYGLMPYLWSDSFGFRVVIVDG